MSDTTEIYVKIGTMTVDKVFKEIQSKKKEFAKNLEAATRELLKKASSKGATLKEPDHGMGYQIKGMINEIKKVEKGNQIDIVCKATFYLFEIPKNKLRGAHSETATVTSGKKPNEVEKAVASCVKAAVKALVNKKLVPAIVKLGAPKGPKKMIYVNIGNMKVEKVFKEYKSKKKDAEKAMKEVAKAGVKKAASKGFITKEPKDKKGYQVSGTVTEITKVEKGNVVEVGCKLKWLISDLPNNSMWGFPSGSATVTTDKKPKNIEGAVTDCVKAVAESVFSKTVVPAIVNRAGP